MTVTSDHRIAAPEDKVVVFHTTLRDGAQPPDITFSVHEKGEIGEQLARLGVDVIEAGFPAASDGDFCQRRSDRRLRPRLDDRRAVPHPAVRRGAGVEAIKNAESPRLHTFISTSVHRHKKLRMTTDQVLAETAQAVAQASSYCADVEFSAEDRHPHRAGIPDRRLLGRGRERCYHHQRPDTVGFAMPPECLRLVPLSRVVAHRPILGKQGSARAADRYCRGISAIP